MPTEEEIKIKITADTSDFKKGMDEAAKAAEKLDKASDKGQGGKKGFSASVEEMSDASEKVKDKFNGIGKEGEKSGGILKKAYKGVHDSFLDLGASSKLATIGTVGLAIAAFGIVGKLASEAYKKLMGLSGKMAQMYNPASFEKATNQMNASINKMKTSLGAVLEPLYKAMTWIVGGISDALNGVLETIVKIYGWFVGFIGLSGMLSRDAEDYSDAMEEATASASAGLSAFDKLNTLDSTGDATQAQRIRDLMADAAESANGVRENIVESLNPMKMLAQAFQTMGLESQWNGFVESGKNAWSKVTSFGSQAWDSIKVSASSMWGSIESAFEDVVSKIKGVFSDIWNSISNAFTGAVGNASQSIMDGFIGALKGVMDFFPNLWNRFKEVGAGIFSGLADMFRNIFGGINLGSLFDSIKEGFRNALNWVIDMWNGSVANIGWEADIFGNKVGINTYGLKIPRFAAGTVIEPNDPFLAVVGDNTREREIISPESAMEDVFRRVLSESGGFEGGVKKIEVTVNLDGRKVARGIYDHLESESRRRGASQ